MKALSILLLTFAAGAQQPSPAFDAASIRQNHSASNGIGGMVGITRTGGVSIRNAPVSILIDIAYDLPATGFPAWATTTGYDVEAKPEHPVDYQTGRLMLQKLLAQRFGLQAHHETVVVPGFHLVVDKGGSKLQPSDAQIGFRIQQMGELQGPADMRMLVAMLKGLLRAPVEDQTGMTGKFDIHLTWTPDAPANASGDTASEPALSIFAAIKQQLGLSLETAKMPLERIVIDHVERPTEN